MFPHETPSDGGCSLTLTLDSDLEALTGLVVFFSGRRNSRCTPGNEVRQERKHCFDGRLVVAYTQIVYGSTRVGHKNGQTKCLSLNTAAATAFAAAAAVYPSNESTMENFLAAANSSNNCSR